uniref:Uncharacterized protein n=1 Tax=viral metagenome TaxID=1070528 RepID=A0A6H2A3X0_9ZZZZ
MDIPKSLLKNNEKYACKSTKKERRKKAMRFADLATKRLGKLTEPVGICLRKCLNRDKKCEECYRFSNLKELK